MNTLSPIHLGSPGEDISKKDIHKVVQRFIHLNQTRLQRIQSFLQPRQGIFLELLPLLFHQNHPLLPGFISLETVAGIPDYTPSRQSILQAKSFSKHFNYKRRALREYPIHGVFLMGSVSSIAFSKHSDIDIWLCHAHGLLKPEIDELQAKATAIEKWSESLDLEVHFFLIDSETFIQGEKSPLSSDSSGQTQHCLLLEEFYRTVIYIAGRPPIWWIVPPQEEHNYTQYVQHLKEKRFIADQEFIDFGSLEDIPAAEFVTATLWHLYKSLNSPYKSLLKLLLMECYASEYPNLKWLCQDVKANIYRGGYFDMEALDPYVLIYHKTEQYLKAENDLERLNFARQCFYYKIMGDMESAPSVAKRTVRETIIAQMARQYQWPANLATSFAQQRSWNIQKASQENDIIIRQLKLCYQRISHFSNTNAYTIKNKDIQLIGRKLKSFLQKRPGKIEIITTRANIHNKANELSLIEAQSNTNHWSWSLFPNEVPANNPKKLIPFKQGARSLVEMLSWLVINGLYQQKLKLHIRTSQQSFTNSDINNTLKALKTFILQHDLASLTTLNSYKKVNRTVANLLFINLGHDAQINRTDGTFVISERSDILSYGPQRENFVQTIDLVSISSWGELTTTRFLGLTGLFDCFIASCRAHPPLPTNIECYTPIRGNSIALGVSSLFKQLTHLLSQQTSTTSARLIAAGGPDFYLFQHKESGLHYWKTNNLEALLLELAKPQANISPVHFYGTTLDNTPLPLLFSFCKANSIQVFYFQREHDIQLFIIDEKGSLFKQRHHNTSVQQLLTAYSNFLATLSNNGILATDLLIEHYELSYSTQEQYSSKQIAAPPALAWDYLNIRITGETYNSPTEIIYTLYCNELEFCSSDTEDNIFELVANYIYELRQSQEQYPIHITEVDVPLQVLGVDSYEQLQAIHYLRYKQKIEARLNTK